MRSPTIWRAAITVVTTTAVSSFAFAPDQRTPLLKTIDALLEAAHYDSARVMTITAMHDAEARGDSASTGTFAFRLGRVSVTLGHQPVARRELDRAIRLTTASRDTANLTQALLFRGFVHRDMKEFDEAMANFRRARDLAHRAHIASAEGDAIYNIAYRELRQGNLEAARPGYLRAMDLWRSTGNQFLIASGGNALGNLYTVLGDVDSARYWYNQALHISRSNGYPFYELWSRNNLGDIDRRLGNYEEGLEQYRTALAIGQRIKFDRGIALTSMNMALMLSYLGQRDSAFTYLDDALTVCKRAGFKDLEVANMLYAGALNIDADNSARAATLFRRILNLDFVYDINKRNEAAFGLSAALAQMDSVEQAIVALEPCVSPGATIANNMSQLEFRVQYAGLLQRAGRSSEALTRLHDLEPELAGNKELGVVARLMESSCRREMGDKAGAAAALTAAIDSLELARSHFEQADVREAYGLHLMNDVIEGCRVLLEYPDTVPYTERVHNFYDALQRFKTRTLLERIRDPRGEGSAALGPGVAQPITAAHLQNAVLQPGEILLDLVVSAEESFMFAVTADSCRMVALPGWRSELREKTELYAGLLSSHSNQVQSEYPAERLDSTQRTLGKTILGPVADLIGQSQRVIFAPDGFYASIPLGTLAVDDTGMLMQSKDVVDIPSASVLEWARAERAGGARKGASMVAVTGGSAEELPGAQHEAESLRRRYVGVELVAASEGVLDTLSRRARPNCILHIASHARVNDASPWQSGFLLANETYLHAWEIARAKLPYEMAVLAGCETAAGRTTNGEGVLGLTSSFLSAGVPVVISSRWPVDDLATAALMEKFYDRLAAGKTVAAALRSAQLAMRENNRTSHPFYWAGFAVVGDGSRVIPPLVAERRHTTWPITVACAALAIVLAIVVARRVGAREKAHNSSATA